jgi:hypothetical protein
MVKPVDPFQGGELERFEAAPWSAPGDDYCDRIADGFVFDGQGFWIPIT